MNNNDDDCGYAVVAMLLFVVAWLVILPFVYGCKEEAAAPPLAPKVGQVWGRRYEDPFMDPLYVHILDVCEGYCLYEYVKKDGSTSERMSRKADDIQERWTLLADTLEEWRESR